MKKLIHGILDFRKKHLESYLDNFSHLAKGQKPDTLFITCSDSRIVPNFIVSSNPGDLFVVRNVGNIIPPYHENGKTSYAEAAAIEFSLSQLPITEIVVCGHSECGAMQAVCSGLEKISAENLRGWLGNAGKESMTPCQKIEDKEHNHLAQLNVLKQLEHIMTYPLIASKVGQGDLNLHGWFFNIAEGSIYAYEKEDQRFILLDTQEANKILARLK